MPSYTSYQDSSSALTIGSPLLSYLNVRLPGFLPQGLTSEEARHLVTWLVKHDSLEPIQDSSGDTIFEGRAIHIPLEAAILGDSNEEDPVTEEAILEKAILPNPIEEMVQKRSMVLDRWFQASEG